MTSSYPSRHDQPHITDFLPVYLNGTLDPATAARARAHLSLCESCRAELATWEMLRSAAQASVAAAPLPSVHVLSRAMAAIDFAEREKRPAALWRRFASRITDRYWLLCKTQALIIHKSIWIITPLVLAFGVILAIIAIAASRSHLQIAESILSLITALSSASGVAFLHGEGNDPGLELTLSMPTSTRVVMFYRLALVVGYNFFLAVIASLIIAMTHGGSVWEIMQVWLGPLLLLSSITLTLSVIIGSWFAMLAGILLESLRAMPDFISQHVPLLQAVNPSAWATSPTVIVLAVILIIFAVFYAPRQPKLSR